jgi:hypothetical protein
MQAGSLGIQVSGTSRNIGLLRLDLGNSNTGQSDRAKQWRNSISCLAWGSLSGRRPHDPFAQQ